MAAFLVGLVQLLHHVRGHTGGAICNDMATSTSDDAIAENRESGLECVLREPAIPRPLIRTLDSLPYPGPLVRPPIDPDGERVASPQPLGESGPASASCRVTAGEARL